MVRGIFRWSRRHPALAFLLLENLLLAFPYLKALALQVEVTPVQHGQELADRLGCFRCHGPDGTGGVPNPGSKEGEIPAFQGGMLMMYVENDNEIREYILDGMPARKRTDPEYVQQMEQQALSMPAYRGYLSEKELADLVAYLKAASGLVWPQDDLAVKGMNLAYKNGCFACHNVMGSGGFKNPGSFKGYIPGWWGNDFNDLVRGEEELQEWRGPQALPHQRKKRGSRIALVASRAIRLSSALEEMDEKCQHEQREERGKDEKRLAIGLVARVSVGCLLCVLWHGVIPLLDEKGSTYLCRAISMPEGPGQKNPFGL